MFSKQIDLSIGQLEAEAELSSRSNIRLEEVFYDLINIEKIFEKENKFLLIGGKGSGKTAFARMYQKKTVNNYNKFSSIITKSDFNFEKVLQEIPSEISKCFDDNRSVQKHLIEWLILNQLLDLLKNNEYVKSLKQYENLIEFQKINRGIVSIKDREIIESFKQFQGDVDVALLNKFLKINFGKNSTFKFQKASFIKVIPDLKNTIKLILSKINEYATDESFFFTLVIDDLDHDMKNIEEHRNLLMDIIRIVKDYNISYIEYDKVFLKVVLLLRPDIVSELNAYSDSFKTIESYKTSINWYDHELYQVSELSTHLRQLVNARIKKVLQSFDGRKIHEDSWYDLIDKSADRESKSIFKWCLNQTRYRPRDIIFLVNNFLMNMKKGEKVNFRKINSSMYCYSRGLWKEIQNELCFYFDRNQLQLIENVLKNLPYFFNLSNMKEQLKSNKINDYEPEKLLELLFNNSVIGNHLNGKYYYKHREENEPLYIDFSKEFILNSGLTYYFNQR